MNTRNRTVCQFTNKLIVILADESVATYRLYCFIDYKCLLFILFFSWSSLPPSRVFWSHLIRHILYIDPD